MTIDGTSVSTTATATYLDSDAAPNRVISLGDGYNGFNLSVNGINYLFAIAENAIVAEDFSYIYTPGQTTLMVYGFLGEGATATITPSVPVVINSIREVAA